MKYSYTTLAIAFFTLFASTAYGQTEGSDNITATANVVSAIQVSPVQGLGFGDFNENTSSIIAPDNASAGHLQVSGVANQGVSLNFTLPDGGTPYTYGLQRGGGDTADDYVELTFSATDGIWNQGENATASGGTAFNPTAEATPNLGSDGFLEVYIGGTAIASANQPDGTYTGTITLTVDYTE